jgi:hypothetical protein
MLWPSVRVGAIRAINSGGIAPQGLAIEDRLHYTLNGGADERPGPSENIPSGP